MTDPSGLPAHRDSTDAVLARAIVERDVDAFAEVYDRHGGVIYSFAVRLCGAEHAEAVTRQVFLSLWRAPAGFSPSDGSLRMPLLARAHGRANELADEDPQGAQPAMGVNGATRDLLSHLPAAEQIAIALAYVGGLTYDQVATMVQRPKDAVAADIRTGLSRLAAA